MTVEEFINLSDNAKMPDSRFQNKKYKVQEYPVRDMMNGTVKIMKYTGKVRGWMWSVCTMKHCVECSEPIIVYGNTVKQMSDSFCGKQCKFKYHHSQLEPIEYNGKIYTLKDCCEYDIRTHLNPIKRHIDQLETKRKLLQNPDWVKQDREKRNIAMNLDRKENPAKHRIRSIISSVFRRAGKKKIAKTVYYGIDVKAIAEYLELLALQIGKSFKWMCENNYHIDHIIPVSLYDHNNKEDFRNCNNPSNLRWLPAKENLSRNNKLRPEDIEIIKTLSPEIYPKSWGGVIPV